jgi:hypothetical protein
MLSSLGVSIPVGTSDAGSYFNNKVLAEVDYGVSFASQFTLSNDDPSPTIAVQRARVVRKCVSRAFCGLDINFLPRHEYCTSKQPVEQAKDVHSRDWMANCRFPFIVSFSCRDVHFYSRHRRIWEMLIMEHLPLRRKTYR